MDGSNISNINQINHNIYFLRDLFKEYYKNNFVNSTIAIEKREIGIGDFGKKISARHLSFANDSALNEYLRTKTPFFISYSVGYYNYPDKRGPMEEKQLTGADIVYEFDSDDFDLDCKNKHDIWVCKNPECKKHGTGHISNCTECGSVVEITEWTCDICLNKAKTETKRLIDFLETDFNLDPSYFIISFSGSKGYHIRLTNPSIINLSKSARLQMMNYILARDLDLKQLGFEYLNKQWSCPTPNKSNGWSKKIMDFMIDYVNTADHTKLKNDFNFSKLKTEQFLEKKDDILNKMHNNILYSNFSNGQKFWQNLIDFSISQMAFKIDPMSSSDIYKIMRMPDTLHGGTGFLSNTIESVDKLNDFDPFFDPVVLDNKNFKKIKILKPTPKFRIKDQTYGPYDFDEEIELPISVSSFLILKGVAI